MPLTVLKVILTKVKTPMDSNQRKPTDLSPTAAIARKHLKLVSEFDSVHTIWYSVSEMLQKCYKE